MKKHKATLLIMFLWVCMVSSSSFAIPTDATGDEEGTERPGNDTEGEEECGFFCAIGDFFEDLF